MPRWNKYLGKFLTSLCKHLNKRLAKEANAETQSEEQQQSSGEHAGNCMQHQGRQELSTDLQRRLAKVVLRMADKAQYSKVCATRCMHHLLVCVYIYITHIYIYIYTHNLIKSKFYISNTIFTVYIVCIVC